MPVKFGSDRKGCYAQWGSQKKYYYQCGNKTARERAKEKAEEQAAAIYASGYREGRKDAGEPSTEAGKLHKQRMENAGITKPQKAVPTAMRHPAGIEREYAQELRKWIRPLRKLTVEILYPIITELKETYEIETGKRDSYSDDIDNVMFRLETSWIDLNTTREDPEQLAFSFAKKTEKHNKKSFDRQVKSITGINPIVAEPWLETVRDSFVAENVSLIKSIPEEYFRKVEGVVRRGVEAGRSTQSIRDRLQKQFNLSVNRANLIARDQIGKYNGQLTRERSTDLGLKKFVWVTAGDARVRTAHRALNGKSFTWKRGADGLFPGMDIQCRCIAENDFSDFF